MSSYTKAAQNAADLGEAFALGDITAFNVTLSATTADSAIAHGLSGTPDFVFISTNTTDDAAGAGAGVGYTATATTLTITQNTAAAATAHVIAGNLK